ncbi:unnamed protein product [Rhizoctonia solani]|uniref:Uncharacterized protein n=1 Tax=Rhizoctonia solani TaxID=456999 RepID=A0A8H3A691_9AGAM|nr:unnamed protein product [Rhizoctonia solani]
MFPTPAIYTFVVKCCYQLEGQDHQPYKLLASFPFPKVSSQLVDLLSRSGVSAKLADLLGSTNVGAQAFAIAQSWLLFNMCLQAPDRTSPALNTLEDMLLQYPALGRGLENQEKVAEDLTNRLLVLLSQPKLNPDIGWDQEIYLSRVLECMLQHSDTPLPERTSRFLEGLPERLRGIASFMNLEEEAWHSSPSNPSHVSLESTEDR